MIPLGLNLCVWCGVLTGTQIRLFEDAHGFAGPHRAQQRRTDLTWKMQWEQIQISNTKTDLKCFPPQTHDDHCVSVSLKKLSTRKKKNFLSKAPPHEEKKPFWYK